MQSGARRTLLTIAIGLLTLSWAELHNDHHHADLTTTEVNVKAIILDVTTGKEIFNHHHNHDHHHQALPSKRPDLKPVILDASNGKENAGTFDNRTETGVTEYPQNTLPRWKKNLDFVATLIMTCNTVNLMLGMGCATYWRDVISHTWPPTGIVIGMIGQFIILPATGSFLSWIFKLTPYEAMGVLMVSCSPGGSFSNFFTFWCDGDLALSIVMTTFSSVLAFGGMPFNLWLYSKIWISSDEATPMVIPYSSIMTALGFITIPVAIGMIVRHYNVKIARIITKVSSILGWLGCGSVLVIWIILYWKVFVEATPLIYLSAFLLPLLGFTLAYIFALILCRTHKICRTIGIETGSQNMVVALSIIILTFKDPQVKSKMLLFPTLYGVTLLLEMFTGIGMFQGWKKYKKKSSKNDRPPTYRASIEKAHSWEKESFRSTSRV